MAESVIRLEIRGRVQGVGYRASMTVQARRLGLRGWVRNRRDGSVEAVVAGPADVVQRLVDWSKCGPPSAVVDSVESFAAEGRFVGFEQRPNG
jgi:acylphosphatase